MAKLAPHLSLVGRCSDAELARRVRCSRTVIDCLRVVLRIPAFVPDGLPPAVKAECVRRIRSREYLIRIADDLRVTVGQVRKVAATIGWDQSWISRRTKSDQVGCLPRARVLDQIRRGDTFTAIAARAGVSHQRIAQVYKETGLPGRHELAKPLVEARRQRLVREREQACAKRSKDREQRRTRRTAKLRRFLAVARRLYDRGVFVNEIAKRYQIPGRSMSWWIFRGRREFGWFPKRSGA